MQEELEILRDLARVNPDDMIHKEISKFVDIDLDILKRFPKDNETDSEPDSID